jgi:hypothetical protein
MEYFSAYYIYNILFGKEQNLEKIITDKPITDEVFFFLCHMVRSEKIDLLNYINDDKNDEFIIKLLVVLNKVVMVVKNCLNIKDITGLPLLYSGLPNCLLV